jgi:pyridoxamine 5'-phosphate oxidase
MQRVSEVEKRFAGQVVLPRPPGWGGVCVKAESIEFWQGQPSRLHDRICYLLQANSKWKMQRLAP